MPEIEDCRKCAVCCHDCLFLHLDKKKKLYSCLIYRNKDRFPISSPFLHSIYHPDEERIEERYYDFFNLIESIAIGKSTEDYSIYKIGVCDRWICYPLTEHKRVREDISKLEKASLNNRYLNEDSREEERESIPNFDVLVEILNG